MPSSFEYEVIKFLLAVERITVVDIADATDVAAEFKIPFLSALLRSQFVQPIELSVATEAVHAMTAKQVDEHRAAELFESALQKGLTFTQALAESKHAERADQCKSFSPTSGQAPLLSVVPEDPTRLGELLIAAKFISRKQLETALAMCAWQDVFIGQALVSAKAITRKMLDDVLECQQRLRAGFLKIDEVIFALHYCNNADATIDETIAKFALGQPARTVRISA